MIAKKKVSKKKVSRKKTAVRKKVGSATASRSKKKVSKRTTKKKIVRRKRAAAKKPKRRFFLPLLWLIVSRASLAGFLCLAGLMIYLDRQIQQRFESNFHPQPAHIYARPSLLAPGQFRTPQQVVALLDRLGYRRVGRIANPGNYAVVGEQMDLFLNTVKDYESQPQQVRLEFAGGALTRLVNHDGGRPISALHLEPELIGSLQLGPYEDRIALTLQQIPGALVTTLLAMEDRSFERHIGVDAIAIARAMVNNTVNGKATQGGSTITQQLVKNLFLTPQRSLSRKVTEALMAVTMELRYSKTTILEHYVNEIFLGQAGNRAVHGFALASEYYFARPLAELKQHEIALLVGMIPAPSAYNPHRFPERALARRNLVLKTLSNIKVLGAEETARLSQLPLGIAPHRPRSSTRFPAYVDYLHRQIRQYFSEEVLRSDGLKLYTTLDVGIQLSAQQALSKTLKDLELAHGIETQKLQGAAAVVDIASGDIVALVGDRQAGFSGFNRALDAERPIGSLVKPLVYLTALEQPKKYSLATVVDDTPLTLSPKNGETWSPQNYDKQFRGSVGILESLVRSYNVPTVRVGLDVGVDNVLATIRRLGVKRKLANYPSLLLGANNHSPIEVAQLYQGIANRGVRIPLRSLNSIGDNNDNTVARFPPVGERVIDRGPAYLIDYALKQVVRRGTAARLNQQFNPALQLAGKTGTTDDYRDSWFAGYSGNLLTVVWLGRDDNKPIGLTGSSGAMVVWDEIMAQLALTAGDDEVPDGIEFVEVDLNSGLLAKEKCEQVAALPILSSDRIKRYAPCAGVVGRIQSWFDLDGDNKLPPMKTDEEKNR